MICPRYKNCTGTSCHDSEDHQLSNSEISGEIGPAGALVRGLKKDQRKIVYATLLIHGGIRAS